MTLEREVGRAAEERYCPSGRFSLQGRRDPYLSALGHPRPGGGRHDHGCHRAPGLHRGWRASDGLRMPVTVDRHEPTARLRALEVPSGPLPRTVIRPALDTGGEGDGGWRPSGCLSLWPWAAPCT